MNKQIFLNVPVADLPKSKANSKDEVPVQSTVGNVSSGPGKSNK